MIFHFFYHYFCFHHYPFATISYTIFLTSFPCCHQFPLFLLSPNWTFLCKLITYHSSSFQQQMFLWNIGCILSFNFCINHLLFHYLPSSYYYLWPNCEIQLPFVDSHCLWPFCNFDSFFYTFSIFILFSSFIWDPSTLPAFLSSLAF